MRRSQVRYDPSSQVGHALPEAEQESLRLVPNLPGRVGLRFAEPRTHRGIALCQVRRPPLKTPDERAALFVQTRYGPVQCEKLFMHTSPSFPRSGAVHIAALDPMRRLAGR